MGNYFENYSANIMNFGKRRTPRGLSIHSLHNITVECVPGTTYVRKGSNPLIGFMEGLQLIAGIFDPIQIARIAPKADLSLFTYQAAYGPRVKDQLPMVVEKLKNDPDTRQAVLILADPNEPLEQRPCTNTIQFMRVRNALRTHVTMRSSDAVWGLPYDLIQFTMLGDVVAASIGAVATELSINIGDAHIYDRHADKIKPLDLYRFHLPGYSPKQSLEMWIDWAKRMIPMLDKNLIEDEFGWERVLL